MKKAYVIGLDYGSDSVRSVLVDADNGVEISSAVFYYPRWNSGEFCDPVTSQFRQHPLDYIEGLEFTILECLQKSGNAEIAKSVKAISIDTTGSTPIAVDEKGIPLALTERFANNPNAMFVLWKDHTAVREAQEINDHAQKYDIDYLKYVGGIYSSEWFWAKLLHVLRDDQEVRNALYTWVEHCDYIPFLLTGGKRAQDIKRSVCSAGHKSLWAAEFGGLPPNQFFAELDPYLDGMVDRLFTDTHTAAESAGTLSEEWATRLGLSTEVVVGVGAFDCHMGAVGGQIEPYYLSKVMGTSTCDMLVAPHDEVGETLVKGICGQVAGSIIPGMIGMEAGQSAFGDAYAWFKQVLSWPFANIIAQSNDISPADKVKIANLIDTQLIPELSRKAEALPVTESSELAIDWFNGRRTPDADQTLKGALLGLHLGTDAVRIFRSIVEATCFGAKSIADRFVEQGVPVKGLIGLGGVAKKSPYIMQTMADVMNMPIRIHKSEQTCAMGAAMFAATAAGIYAKVEDAMEAMGQGFEKTYEPRPEMVAIYAKRYEHYKSLGAFIVETKH
ncbi:MULTISPECIES: ribulokinase [Sphingobacterium]|uniref:ribulokinase n=2 Tax=Sphingobacteriaceae TaxID=84566 RepID=UPI00104E6C13|nr:MULTISPECIES: ribulokinase [Sphingobacterium]MCW2263831.1 L-ribulokinase [Sphingobacterium kitahiroshimense]TCR00371.1 L-ribulokinase [Sphingobacterium sp. JUb78]